ncbi:MAG: hypothetical protein AB7G11_17350 [Phycisphaerales bacterium]
MSRPARTPLIPIDAGWLFLLPGLVLLSATVLIPAYNDVLDARWARDRAAAIEQSRLDRLSRYGQYLDALERQDPSVVKSLAASQLNMVPESYEPLSPPVDPANVPASVFPLLEPEPLTISNLPPARQKSRLEVWSTSDRTRVWLIAAGGLCVLVGLLPPAVRSASHESAANRETPRRAPMPGRRRGTAAGFVGPAEKPAEAPETEPLPAIMPEVKPMPAATIEAKPVSASPGRVADPVPDQAPRGGTDE